MAAPALPLARARLDPQAFLWLLVAIALATLNAPADVWGTIDHLRVPDTDDAMRLAGVRDLVAGQGWYDDVQHRFLPPGGVESHWSRLVDAPIAALEIALAPLGRRLAEGLTAALWPTLLLGVYLAVLHRGARASFGPRAAVLAVLVATQTFGVAVQFQAGRVDHHNVQMIAILGLALGLVRGGRAAGLAAGGLAALSLAVGLEGLPYVVLGALFLALDWVARGRPALPAFLGFGLGLGLACGPLFAVQTAPRLWGVTACDALSPPWLWLAVGGGASALACAGLDARLPTPRARLALAAACGAAVAAGFAALFPACLGGPFPNLTPLARANWLLTVNEMTAVPTFLARRQWEILVFYPVVALAALTATAMAWRGPGRRAWAVAALFLWPGALMGLAQFRGIYVATGLVPLVAGAVIDRALHLARDRLGSAPRRWGAAALAASLVGSAWLGPEALAEALAPPEAARDPQGAIACHADAAVRPLAALEPGTVLAPIFMGPSILLRTPHAVVAAPYHRAVAGLTAAIVGLGGTEDDLRAALDATGARYLVACPARPAIDLRGETAFATRLARGEAAADWLEPVAVPGGLKVWRVAR